ncbi:MAG: porin [Zoogloeaceae bacterium]|nr:porin [Zoogloeaceae bacterium]
MRKKTLALALAALASGAASAQTNVTVYGLIDVGFSHRGDNITPHTSSQNKIDDGVSSGSRLGFKGTEDLGNGLKAVFTLENGFGADTGTLRQSGRLFGRQIFLGLTGSFGTAIAGRLHTPHYSFLVDIDPFGSGLVGRYRNVFDVTHAKSTGVGGKDRLNAGGENLFDPVRVDNTIAYVSPTFAGFNVTAAYSTNAILDEHTGNNHDNTVIALLPRYKNGPVDIGVSYHRIKDDDRGAGVNGLVKPKITNWVVGGAYDFNALKLSAFYDRNKASADGIKDVTLKSWLIGAKVPFGKHTALISYTQSKLDDGTSGGTLLGKGKAKQWALGYTYDLSKRSNFYAAYAKVSNEKHDGEYTRNISVGDGSNGGSGYQNGFQFGLRHKF